MTSDTFQGLLLREVDGAVTAAVETIQRSDLPDGDVTVRVEYSDVNYKDGMTITGVGHRRIAQFFPFIPGIDFAGVVEESRTTQFAPGDRVVLTGWGVGEKWWGGHAQKARVKAMAGSPARRYDHTQRHGAGHRGFLRHALRGGDRRKNRGSLPANTMAACTARPVSPSSSTVTITVDLPRRMSFGLATTGPTNRNSASQWRASPRCSFESPRCMKPRTSRHRSFGLGANHPSPQRGTPLRRRRDRALPPRRQPCDSEPC
jgi:hypothetical protein